MTRLTKQIKKDMIEELIKHGKFYDDIKAKQQAITSAGDKIWHSIFDKYLEVIKSLPEGMIQRAECIKLMGIENPFSTSHYSTFKVELSDYKPTLAYNKEIAQEIHGLINEDTMIIGYINAKKALQDSEAKLKQAKADAEAILSSCNSFSQLWNAWAEAKPVLEKFENQGEKIYPIAKPIQILNATFGLEKGEQVND